MPTKIEWCDETLNPFWGCTHGCSYCQARRIAHMRAERIGKARGYKPEVIAKMKRFEPVWLPDADRILRQLWIWKKHKTVFVGFMGDIACISEDNRKYFYKKLSFRPDFHPQHRYLILSKNIGVALPPDPNAFKNIWWGYSDDGTGDNRDWVNFKRLNQTFISYEPLLGQIKTLNHHLTKWVIIGALTDRRGQPVPPEKGGTRLEWVMPIIEVADKHNIPVFLKNNLLKLYPQLPMRQEFPW